MRRPVRGPLCGRGRSRQNLCAWARTAWWPGRRPRVRCTCYPHVQRSPPRCLGVDVRGVPERDAELHGLPEDRLSGVGIQSPVAAGPAAPKLMQPSAMRLTFRPELPRRVHSMGFLSGGVLRVRGGGCRLARPGPGGAPGRARGGNDEDQYDEQGGGQKNGSAGISDRHAAGE
jgi:hypothetical protein